VFQTNVNGVLLSGLRLTEKLTSEGTVCRTKA